MCASNRGTNGAAPFDSDRSRQRSGVQHCVSVGSSLISQRAITQSKEHSCTSTATSLRHFAVERKRSAGKDIKLITGCEVQQGVLPWRGLEVEDGTSSLPLKDLRFGSKHTADCRV
eukprot:1160945-Pelagomonas_calceolata.AAC.3